MQFVRGDVEHIALGDRLDAFGGVGFASPFEHDDLMFVVVSMMGSVSARFDHEMSQGEVGHAVISTEEDPHRDVLDAIEFHRRRVPGIQSRPQHVESFAVSRRSGRR